MITVRFYDEENKGFSAQAIKASANGGVQTPVSRTDAHDESLDTCLLSILTDGHDLPEQKPYVEEWTKVRVSFDGDEKDYFVTQCDSTVVARKRPENGVKKTVYKVELQLIELIFVTQYISMDNLIFSHDIDANGNVITKTITEVLARVNNQIYTMPESDKNNPVYGVPFKLLTTYSSIFWWGDMPAPELYFNGKTLFQILVEIGDYVGGFPYLIYSKHGEYELLYRQWNDNNVARHTLDDSEIEYVEYHTTTDGSATVVDSTVENMLNSSVNGENTAVYPLPGNEISGNYGAVKTESYDVQITNDNCFFEVPHPIEKILKIEIFYSMIATTKNERYYYLVPNTEIKEYDEWILLRDSYIGDSFADYKTKGQCLYYKRGEQKVENLKEYAIRVNPDSDGTRLFMRVTYIPRLNGRIKKQRGTNEKPISYIVNQQSNVVNSSAYGKYLQGLVDRMTGNYTVYTVVNERNPKTNNQKYTLFKKGEFLNGERIYRAAHTYSPKAVISKYYTSANWNRRANFVAVPHNQRTWRIPAADEVTLRNLHYAEDVFISVGEFIPYGFRKGGYIQRIAYGNDNPNASKALTRYTNKTSKGTVAGVENQDINFARPSLAYIAFKNNRAINSDADDQSNGYAMASCDPVPVDKSIIMTWTAEDNASMGGRSVAYNGPIDETDLSEFNAQQQYFVSYPEKAEYLQFKLSSESPAFYNYNKEYTQIGNCREEGTNLSFSLGFPICTKKQFLNVDETSLYKVNNLDFSHLGIQFAYIPFIKIDKDLRERIAFTYQLDFKGYGETIVYEKACVWSPLCSRDETKLRVFINSSMPYSENDIKSFGTEVNVADNGYSGTAIALYFNDAFSWNNLAICDKNGDLMFATNKSGTTPISTYNNKPCLYIDFFNALKKWKKI